MVETSAIKFPRSEKNNIRQFLRRWDWLLVLAIAPAMLFPNPRHAWVLLGIPVILAIMAWAWGELLPVTPLNLAILLLEVTVGISVYVTPSLDSSLGKITGIFFGILLFTCVIRHTRSRQGWIGSLALFTLTGIGLAVLGLMGTKWLTTRFTILNILTARLPALIRGLPGAESGFHSSELAGSLLWVIPVIILAGIAILVEPKWFASRSGRGKVRVWNVIAWAINLGVGILMTLSVLILSQSRTGYLAIGITAIVILFLVLRGKARIWILALLAISLIAGIVLVVRFGQDLLSTQNADLLPMDTSALSTLSLSQREEIWAHAIWVIEDVPLTGLGMNIFRSAVYLIYPTFRVSAGYEMGHAHNELLQAALDLGLPGLVGFLALYVGALGMLIPLLKMEGARHFLAIGLLGGLLAHFLFGMLDAVALGAKPGFLFWWMLGMVYGLYHQTRIKVAG